MPVCLWAGQRSWVRDGVRRRDAKLSLGTVSPKLLDNAERSGSSNFDEIWPRGPAMGFTTLPAVLGRRSGTAFEYGELASFRLGATAGACIRSLALADPGALRVTRSRR